MVHNMLRHCVGGEVIAWGANFHYKQKITNNTQNDNKLRVE